MNANDKKFSTATLHCTEKELRLTFPGGAGDGPPPGGTVVLGALALVCDEPSCKSGTDPFKASTLDMEIRLTPGSTAQASLLATASGMGGTWAPVPVFDASYADPCGHDGPSDQCGGLCKKLNEHRAAAKLPPGTRYCVYKVTETPAELASLQGKLIAIPVVPGLPGNPG